MLAAGATERDLDVLAVLLVLRVILHTKRDFTRSRGSHRMYCPACRRYVDGGGIGRGDDYVAVESPDRPLRPDLRPTVSRAFAWQSACCIDR